jgi:hypothetical protein
MVRKVLLIITFLLLCGYTTFSQNISVLASTDSTDYLVGDYIHYNIQIAVNKRTKVIQPSLKDSLNDVDLIKVEQPIQEEQNDKESIVYRFILSKYDSGNVVIPPITVMYKLANDTVWKKITTNQVSFVVHTLKVSTAEDIKDVKQPLKISLDWKIILLFILISLIIIGAGIYYYRRYKMKKESQVIEKKIVRVPPHLTALSALRELESEQLWQKGMIKEYHTRITEIIRKYFEKRFNLPALELTTSESIQLLSLKKGASSILDITNDFLNNADLVKFAKFQPMSSVNEEMMKQAFDIVNKTIPKIEEPKVEVSNVQ